MKFSLPSTSCLLKLPIIHSFTKPVITRHGHNLLELEKTNGPGMSALGFITGLMIQKPTPCCFAEYEHQHLISAFLKWLSIPQFLLIQSFSSKKVPYVRQSETDKDSDSKQKPKIFDPLGKIVLFFSTSNHTVKLKLTYSTCSGLLRFKNRIEWNGIKSPEVK